jgi:hypothetical protein
MVKRLSLGASCRRAVVEQRWRYHRTWPTTTDWEANGVGIPEREPDGVGKRTVYTVGTWNLDVYHAV